MHRSTPLLHVEAGVCSFASHKLQSASLRKGSQIENCCLCLLYIVVGECISLAALQFSSLSQSAEVSCRIYSSHSITMAHLFNLIGRIAFAALFIMSAFNKYTDFEATVGVSDCGITSRVACHPT